MANVYNDNVAQVDVLQRWDGQEVENTLYFFSTVPITPLSLDDLAINMRDRWQTEMLPLQSSQVAFFAVSVTHLTPVPAMFAISPALTPNIGGDSNPASPNNVTLAISFQTGLSGRSYRGRNYWIGLTEPNVFNSTVASGLRASIVAAYATMIGVDSVATNWTWCIYSRYVNNVPRETGLAQDVTSVAILDDVVDSQRRRLPGRGR